MPYYLDNEFLLDNPWITVVGCGGTGGFVAEGLCRLFQGRDATIVLVDHDRVEPHNLLQPDISTPRMWASSRARPWPTGWPQAYSRPVGYSVYPFREETFGPRAAATPASPPTTASSSAAPTTPQQGGPWPIACPETPAAGSSTPATTPTGARS